MANSSLEIKSFETSIAYLRGNAKPAYNRETAKFLLYNVQQAVLENIAFFF